MSFKTFEKLTELALYEAIESCRNQEPSQQANTLPNATQESPIEKIKKLSELKDAGIISNDEFLTKKEELLKLV